LLEKGGHSRSITAAELNTRGLGGIFKSGFEAEERRPELLRRQIKVVGDKQ
jgi:hypothetical protein